MANAKKADCSKPVEVLFIGDKIFADETAADSPWYNPNRKRMTRNNIDPQQKMSLSKLYSENKLTLSYELFPPKTPKGEASLYRNVHDLMAFSPDYITCTYGAGGSTRDKTLDIIQNIKEKFSVPVASHLTVVGSTVGDLRDYLQRAKQQGVDYIIALRGDPPEGATEFEQTVGGLGFANELVDLVRAEFREFSIAVAGYPETHREAPDAKSDLENLKRKVDAGADVILTQLFYNNDDFYRFRDQCCAIGIQVPIIPGLLPATSLKQIQRITSLCGSSLPKAFVNRLAEKDDLDWQFKVGIEQAAAQTRDLLEHDVRGLHFYVLNRSAATSSILQAVDINSYR